MNLVFGLGADGRTWPETADAAGGLDDGVVGPQGLVSLIEAQLGLGGPAVSRPARVASWLTKLRAAGPGRFWDRSFGKDAWSTAGTLLDWRDALVAGGWTGQRIGAPRVDDLADADQIGAPLPPGLSDRLAFAARSLADRPGLRIASVVLIEPRPLLPPPIARLLDALEAAGAVIDASPAASLAPAGSDLRRVQDALSGGEREPLTGDGWARGRPDSRARRRHRPAGPGAESPGSPGARPFGRLALARRPAGPASGVRGGLATVQRTRPA